MRIASLVVLCFCAAAAGILLVRDHQAKQYRFATPGVVNTDPELNRKIRQATATAEELRFSYHTRVRRAKTEKELDQATEFYDREVVQAEIQRLKKESLQHSFEYKGVLGNSV